MIICFTRKTSKILPRIFCRNWRHCAIIQRVGKHYLLFNPALGRLDVFLLTRRDLGILKSNGWVFIKTKTVSQKHIASCACTLTCVGFVRRATGIGGIFIWTPDQLYRKIKHNCLNYKLVNSQH